MTQVPSDNTDYVVATYTSAQQVTDFGSNQTTLGVRAFQKNAVLGRGRGNYAAL